MTASELLQFCVIGNLIQCSVENVGNKQQIIEAWSENMNTFKEGLQASKAQRIPARSFSTRASDNPDDSDEYISSLDGMVKGLPKEFEAADLSLFLDGKRYLFESDVGLRIRNFFPFVNELADLPDDDVGTFGIPPFIEKIRVGSWQS